MLTLFEKINEDLDKARYVRVYAILSNDTMGLHMISKVPFELLPEDRDELIVSIYDLENDWITEQNGDVMRGMYIRIKELTNIEYVGSATSNTYITRRKQ